MPYLVDKLDNHYNNIWNEFLRFIGISNLSITKKERLISDEVQALQGGAIASRYSRFSTRKKAVEEINNKFSDYLVDEVTVRYFDDVPSSEKKESEEVEDEQVYDAN